MEVKQLKKLALLIPVSICLIGAECNGHRTTITEPDQIIITVRKFSSGSTVADFVFTQNLNNDNVSLVIQNVSQRVVSFNYTINFSVSGQGWTNDGSVTQVPIGGSVDKGTIAWDSPTIIENGFTIVLSSIVFGEDVG